MDRGTDIFGRVQGWDLARLSQSRWLVVGAGALGNEVLKNLALLGVGEVWILDFDRVESTNLSRSVLYRPEDVTGGRWKAHSAALALHAMNPDLKVRYIIGDVLSDLPLGVLRRMDVVVGCVDNRLARMFLNRHAFRFQMPWVNGGIEQLEGEVGVFAPDIACYECRLTAQGRSEIRKRMSCADLARRYAVAGRAVTTPLAASVAGALMVKEGLQLLFGKPKPDNLGMRMRFNLFGNQFVDGEMAPPGEDCGSHFPARNVIEASSLSAERSLKEVLAELARMVGRKPKIHLDFGVVTAFGKLREEGIKEAVLPRNHLPAMVGEEDGTVGIPAGHFFDVLDDGFPYPECSLMDLGIPLLDVLRVSAGGEQYAVELTGDLGWMENDEGLVGLPSYLVRG